MNHDKLKRYGSNFLFYSVLCAAAFFRSRTDHFYYSQQLQE